MKRILIFSFFVIFSFFIVPIRANAAFSDLPRTIKIVDSVYSNSVAVLKDMKDVKRGSYLPGVFDSRIIKFDEVSVSAKEQIKKKKEEEARKRREEQMKLGNIEAAFDGKYIDIDLKTQTLTAFQDKNPVYRFKVSSGKWTMPTPTGTFSIRNKTSRAYSSKYNLYMPYWMAFTGQGHGIHELPEWPGGSKEGAGHLGRPVSHGCVRLGVGAAETVYDWTNVGDKVYIHK